MAWTLKIHTIDVGQGESSLIVAYNTDTQRGTAMLIDGGIGKYGATVNRYVQANLPRNTEVDFIVASHYDTDHSGGLISLFLADNLYNLASFIAGYVAKAFDDAEKAGNNVQNTAVYAIGAYTAVIYGAYAFPGRTGTSDKSAQIPLAAQAAVNATTGITDFATALKKGFDAAKRYMFTLDKSQVNYSLMASQGASLPKSIGVRAVTDASPLAQNAREDDITDTIFEALAPTPATTNIDTPENATYNFFTGGRYGDTKIYDVGNIDDVGSGFTIKDLNAYKNAAIGYVPVGTTFGCQVPNVERTRNVPVLGDELLDLADPNAPRVYCLARLQEIYNDPGFTTSTDGGNGVSIALLVVFGSFTFYTGGDLPVDGLNQIPNVVLGDPLFGSPTSITAFKVGHHGGAESTSQAFVTDIKPRAAFISCGRHVFGDDPDSVHPRQVVVDILRNQPTLEYFYLTNCKIERTGIPASLGSPQLVAGNKSRVSGDNGYDPGEEQDPEDTAPQPKRVRGNIVLSISQEQAFSTVISPAIPDLTLNQVLRQFAVTYFENDSPDDNPTNPTGNLTVDITF